MVARLCKILARLVNGVTVQSQQIQRKACLPRSSVIPCGLDFNLSEPTNRLQAMAEKVISVPKTSQRSNGRQMEGRFEIFN